MSDQSVATIRMSANDYEIIREAAEIEKTSINKFCKNICVAEAKNIVGNHQQQLNQRIALSQEIHKLVQESGLWSKDNNGERFMVTHNGIGYRSACFAVRPQAFEWKFANALVKQLEGKGKFVLFQSNLYTLPEGF